MAVSPPELNRYHSAAGRGVHTVLTRRARRRALPQDRIACGRKCVFRFGKWLWWDVSYGGGLTWSECEKFASSLSRCDVVRSAQTHTGALVAYLTSFLRRRPRFWMCYTDDRRRKTGTLWRDKEQTKSEMRKVVFLDTFLDLEIKHSTFRNILSLLILVSSSISSQKQNKEMMCQLGFIEWQ